MVSAPLALVPWSGLDHAWGFARHGAAEPGRGLWLLWRRQGLQLLAWTVAVAGTGLGALPQGCHARARPLDGLVHEAGFSFPAAIARARPRSSAGLALAARAAAALAGSGGLRQCCWR